MAEEFFALTARFNTLGRQLPDTDLDGPKAVAEVRLLLREMSAAQSALDAC
jgi:hypothetical protein